jgi:hypothetical protein
VTSLNVHHYITYINLGQLVTREELLYLHSNVGRFVGVISYSNANLKRHDDMTVIPISNDILLTLAPQLREIETQPFTMDADKRLAFTINPPLIERLVYGSDGWPLSLLPTTAPFSRIKSLALSVLASDIPLLALFTSMTTLTELAITFYPEGGPETFSWLRPFVLQNPNLRRLNLKLFSYSASTTQVIFNFDDDVNTLKETCLRECGVTLDKLRLNQKSVWQQKMSLFPATLTPRKCQELFQDCHGSESPADRIASIYDFVGNLTLRHSSNPTWRKPSPLGEIVDDLEDVAWRASDEIMQAGQIIRLDLLLTAAVFITLRELVGESEGACRGFDRFEALLDCAEVTAQDLFRYRSLYFFTLGAGNHFFETLCLQRAGFIAKFKLESLHLGGN